MKKILCIIFCLLLFTAGKAQTVYKDQIRVENPSITRNDDNTLTILADLVLQKNMKISSNNKVTLTPFLEGNGQKQIFPSIVVYGRTRKIIDGRQNITPQNTFAIVQRKKNKEQNINYAQKTVYELWMQHAELKLNIDVCGCCDLEEESLGDLIATADIAPLKLNPAIAYIAPQAESVKHRTVEGKAFLDFRVNKTNIDPDYRRNTIELGKICTTIDTVRNDKFTQLTGITIHGYASPEGNYASNARLAEGRTKALADYVTNYYKFDTKLISSHSTPEDWAGFRKYIEASSMDKKSEILALIDNTQLNVDIKERNIAKLIGPEAYKKNLLEDCYPALRHSDYTVNYTVRGLNIEETKEYLNKRPQLLSLQELYKLALTYKPGSEEFNDVLRVAVAMFPNDATANLNAAAMELEKENIASAKKYLAKADPKQSATLNNLGIIAMIEGDLDLATQYFNQAKAAGNTTEAEANLKELAVKRTYPTK